MIDVLADWEAASEGAEMAYVDADILNAGDALCAELRAHRQALTDIENAMRTFTVGAGSIEMKAKIRGIIEGVRG